MIFIHSLKLSPMQRTILFTTIMVVNITALSFTTVKHLTGNHIKLWLFIVVPLCYCLAIRFYQLTKSK